MAKEIYDPSHPDADWAGNVVVRPTRRGVSDHRAQRTALQHTEDGISGAIGTEETGPMSGAQRKSGGIYQQQQQRDTFSLFGGPMSEQDRANQWSSAYRSQTLQEGTSAGQKNQNRVGMGHGRRQVTPAFDADFKKSRAGASSTASLQAEYAANMRENTANMMSSSSSSSSSAASSLSTGSAAPYHPSAAAIEAQTAHAERVKADRALSTGPAGSFLSTLSKGLASSTDIGSEPKAVPSQTADRKLLITQNYTAIPGYTGRRNIS